MFQVAKQLWHCEPAQCHYGAQCGLGKQLTRCCAALILAGAQVPYARTHEDALRAYSYTEKKTTRLLLKLSRIDIAPY